MEKRRATAAGQRKLVCCMVLLVVIVLFAVVGGFLGGVYLHNKIIDINIASEENWKQKYADVQEKLGAVQAENDLLSNKLEALAGKFEMVSGFNFLVSTNLMKIIGPTIC